ARQLNQEVSDDFCQFIDSRFILVNEVRILHIICRKCVCSQLDIFLSKLRKFHCFKDYLSFSDTWREKKSSIKNLRCHFLFISNNLLCSLDQKTSERQQDYGIGYIEDQMHE